MESTTPEPEPPSSQPELVRQLPDSRSPAPTHREGQDRDRDVRVPHREPADESSETVQPSDLMEVDEVTIKQSQWQQSQAPPPAATQIKQSQSHAQSPAVKQIKQSYPQASAPSQAPPRSNLRPQAPLRRQASRSKTPEPPHPRDRANGQNAANNGTPSTPGHLAPFDWEDFELRYQEALKQAGQEEQRLLKEFQQLVEYFNVWAAAASTHDDERAVKRLQTQTRYVRISESNLQQKKAHLAEVVRAFQSALALLNQS